jgi:hypothetical protein
LSSQFPLCVSYSLPIFPASFTSSFPSITSNIIHIPSPLTVTSGEIWCCGLDPQAQQFYTGPLFLFIIYFNCKWAFTRWQWYYNKTQRHNAQMTHITQNNTPPSNKTQHTKLHKQQRTHYTQWKQWKYTYNYNKYYYDYSYVN